MKKIFKVIPRVNKRNGQINFYLPKRKLPKIFSEKKLKSIKLEMKECEWED